MAEYQPRDSVKARMAADRDMVGISLQGSEETTAALSLVEQEMPDAKVTDNDCYYKIERRGKLEFDMEKLGDILGRDITVPDFLVNMSTYYGRIEVSDGKLQIHSEILPERFRD